MIEIAAEALPRQRSLWTDLRVGAGIMYSGASIGLRYFHGHQRLAARRSRRESSLSGFTAMRPCDAACARPFRNATARLIIFARRCWRVPFRVHITPRFWAAEEEY